MSLRRSVGGTPGTSRVRQPFKSPFRSPVLSQEGEDENTSLAVNGTEKNNFCKETSFGVKDCKISGKKSQTGTPTLPKLPDKNSTDTSSTSTPQKVNTRQSPAISDCRRKLITRPFNSPFRSPSSNQGAAPQQTSSPQEQLAQLRKREAELDQEIQSLQNCGYRSEELQGHIDNLHRYNEVKDAAQIVMGRLAEMEAVTVREMHEKYGVSDCE